MNKKRLTLLVLAIILGGMGIFRAQSLANGRAMQDFQGNNRKKVLYFNPQVYPEIDEIKEATNVAFFSAVSDKLSKRDDAKLLRVDAPIYFDDIDTEMVMEYCKHNDAQYVVIPKVKYFKVGIGKYVFSNQVVVSMKLYDAEGNFITETEYNTYRKNMRLLGSAENSVKIGTDGAIKDMVKKLRKLRKK